ncbi:MAG: hypothetical protein JKX88_05470 [Marinicaulis sp.]|nr:hypothetical protein [Marinicaulis sp.]
MALQVSDSSSNRNEQIENAAKAIGNSVKKRLVFEAVHHGKRAIKTVGEISESTGLSRKQVLDSAKSLVKKHVFEQVQQKHNGDTAYKKNNFLQSHKTKILSLAGNKKKLDRYPTKRNPKGVAVRPCLTARLFGA